MRDTQRGQIDIELLLPFVLLLVAGIVIFLLFIIADTFVAFTIYSLLVIGLLLALREWMRHRR